MLILPVALSLIGLLLLKYYKWFRVLVFCKEVNYEDADYVYIEGSDNFEAICSIEKVVEREDAPSAMFFNFEGLKYEVVQGKTVPIGFRIYSEYKELQNSGHFHRGMEEKIVEEQQKLFGKN